jgi:ATP-dependent 26S proteasome regulatory subunit
MERETAANATPQGADVRAICEEVGQLARRDWRDVHNLVIEATISGAC